MDATADALLTVMGWSGYHLYAFRTDSRHVEIPDPDAVDMSDMGFVATGGRPSPEDAAQVKLGDFAKPGDSFHFDYDFGDGYHSQTREQESMSDEKKDLTNSSLHRQNILNNPFALQEIEKATHIQGIAFEGRSIVLKEQVAAFFEVTPRTVDNYIEKYSDELRRNGYEVLRGNRLKELKKVISSLSGNENDFVTKTTVLGIFDFRAFLNLAMLMVESERARLLRQAILDIVIDTINSRTGGGTKYINPRDEDFLHSWFVEENYRRQFTDALRDCVG